MKKLRTISIGDEVTLKAKSGGTDVTLNYANTRVIITHLK